MKPGNLGHMLDGRLMTSLTHVIQHGPNIGMDIIRFPGMNGHLKQVLLHSVYNQKCRWCIWCRVFMLDPVARVREKRRRTND